MEKRTEASALPSLERSLYMNRFVGQPGDIQFINPGSSNPPSFTEGQPKTSLTHPLRIDTIETSGGGLIGMTFCPGKKQADAASGTWDRDLQLDLISIQRFGATSVVTLMEDFELVAYCVEGLGKAVKDAGMQWYHLPIIDGEIPQRSFEKLWIDVGRHLRDQLAEGQHILLHCRGGLGRTGTIAARLLVERGMPPADAIQAVRNARPDAIETPAQEAYVRSVHPMQRTDC